jgi:hypothetical protein
VNRSSRLRLPPSSPVDGPCGVCLNFGSGLNLTVVDPFEQFVLVKVNFTALAAARNLTQAGECVDGRSFLADDLARFVDRDRTPLFFLQLQMLYRSLQLLQLDKDTADGIRQVFESQFLLFFHNDNILIR